MNVNIKILETSDDERVKCALMSAFDEIKFDDHDFVTKGFSEDVSSDALIAYARFHLCNEFATDLALDDWSSRSKIQATKSHGIDTRSTAKGLAKLKLLKSLARIKFEKLIRQGDESADPLVSFHGYEDLKRICDCAGSPWQFWNALHALHAHTTDAPRQYLWHAFRHYADSFHASAVSGRAVHPRPSYLTYLDSESSLGPTLLPLEFKSFIDDIGTKICDLECTATLVGGNSAAPGLSGRSGLSGLSGLSGRCGRSGRMLITYDYNAEGVPAVRATRSKMARTFAAWKTDSSYFARIVYPEFLHLESKSPFVQNQLYIDRMAALRKEVDELVGSGCNISWLRESTSRALADVSTRYESYAFVSDGEQLMERYSWFLQPSVRELFQQVAASNYEELLFFNLKLSLKTLEPFMAYCNSRKNFTRKTEEDQRDFLVTMRRIIEAFRVAFIGFADEPVSMAREVREPISNSLGLTVRQPNHSRNPFSDRAIRIIDE